METELWPNFLRACARKEIPVFVANGRISDRSLRRYRRLKMLAGSMLHHLTVIGTQSHEDKNRFLELGAEERRVRVTGNLKFDFPHTRTGAAPRLAVKDQIRHCAWIKGWSPLWWEAA